jgi:hypothetical protein
MTIYNIDILDQHDNSILFKGIFITNNFIIYSFREYINGKLSDNILVLSNTYSDDSYLPSTNNVLQISNEPTELQISNYISNEPTELQISNYISNEPTELQISNYISNEPTELQISNYISNEPTELHISNYISNEPTELQISNYISNEPTELHISNYISNEPTELHISNYISNEPTELQISNYISNEANELLILNDHIQSQISSYDFDNNGIVLSQMSFEPSGFEFNLCASDSNNKKYSNNGSIVYVISDKIYIRNIIYNITLVK